MSQDRNDIAADDQAEQINGQTRKTEASGNQEDTPIVETPEGSTGDHSDDSDEDTPVNKDIPVVEAQVAEEASATEGTTEGSTGDHSDNELLKADVKTPEDFIRFSYQNKGKSLISFRAKRLEKLDDAPIPKGFREDQVLGLTRMLAENDFLLDVPFAVLLLLEKREPRPSVRKRIAGLMAQALSCHAAFKSPSLKAALTDSRRKHTSQEIIELFDELENALAANRNPGSRVGSDAITEAESKTLRLNALRSMALYLSFSDPWETRFQIEWHNKYFWQQEAKPKDDKNFWQILVAAKPVDAKRILTQLVTYFDERKKEAEEQLENKLEDAERRIESESKQSRTKFEHKLRHAEQQFENKLKDAEALRESESERASGLASDLRQLKKDLEESEQHTEQQHTEIGNLRSDIAERDHAIEMEQKKGLQASVIAANNYQKLRTRIIRMLEKRSLLLDDALQAALNNKSEIAARRIDQTLKEFNKTTDELRDLEDVD